MEVVDALAEKVTATKRTVDMMSAENTNELLEIKNQIVEAASDVLL